MTRGLLLVWVLVPVVSAQGLEPVTVQQSGDSLIWLASINVFSLAVLAVIARWADARKDQQQAKAIADAAEQAAALKAKEKEQDWARQDAVAAKVAETAERAAAAAAEAVRRQDDVATRVQAAATQAAGAAKLLLEQQADARKRQDEVADRVQTAANQAAEAAVLLATAQARMTAATEEVARLAAEADTRVRAHLRAIDEQGRKIHILVNSDMTAARTDERNSLRRLMQSLQHAAALSAKLGMPRTEADEQELARVVKRVAELDLILADRHQAQLIVEAEARNSGTPPLPSLDGLTVLERDQASRPSPSIVTDGDRRRQKPLLPAEEVTTASLKEIASNTAAIAENTATDPGPGKGAPTL